MFLFPYHRWVDGIFYEHLHRLIASTVGALTLILAIWVGAVEKRQWVRSLAFIGLCAVVLQGMLGGLTVLYRLPVAISVSHAMLAQTFFILTIVLAYSQSKEFFTSNRSAIANPSVFRWSLYAIGVIYFQLFLGALMRHTQSGLAVPDFPTMGGTYLPDLGSAMLDQINNARQALKLNPVTNGQVLIHLLHRGGALIVLAIVGTAAIKVISTKTNSSLSSSRQIVAWAILCALVLQASLGVLTVLSGRSADVTSFHVALGAGLLGLSVIQALRLWAVR